MRFTIRDLFASVLVAATVVIGATALGIAEAAGGPVLLATFIAAVVAVWGFEMLHHAGVVHVRVETHARTSQV